MYVRSVVAFVSIAVFVAVIALELVLPAISTYVLFGLAGWFLASLVIYRLPVMRRRIGGRGGPAPLPDAPAPGAGTGVAPALPSGLDFCLYCAAPVERGVPVCPQCGRALPPT